MRDKRTIDDALVGEGVEGEIRNAGTLSCTAVEGAGTIYGGAVNHTGVSRNIEVIVGLADALVDCTRYCRSSGVDHSLAVDFAGQIARDPRKSRRTRTSTEA